MRSGICAMMTCGVTSSRMGLRSSSVRSSSPLASLCSSRADLRWRQTACAIRSTRASMRLRSSSS